MYAALQPKTAPVYPHSLPNRITGVAPRRDSVTCVNSFGMHNIAVDIYPGDRRRTLLCLHGFSRNRQDFRYFAPALAQRGYQVISMDLAGRGESDSFSRSSQYHQQQMWCDINTVLNKYGVTEYVVVGTSYGACIGMFMGAHSAMFPGMKGLLVNDAAPEMAGTLIEALSRVCGKLPVFESLDQAADDVRLRYDGHAFAKWNLNEWQWPEFIDHSIVKNTDGTYTYAYDEKIVESLVNETRCSDYNMWHAWHSIKCHTLVLRGQNSPVLTREAMNRMLKESNALSVAAMEVRDAGHHPMLSTEDEHNTTNKWLDAFFSTQ